MKALAEQINELDGAEVYGRVIGVRTFSREEGDEIRIGALTRHADLLKSELLARHFPIFGDAEMVIADPVVRNRGTLGGSLCQADPSEDLSAVCTTLNASSSRCNARASSRSCGEMV